MILSASRFVVLDDKREHLGAIIEALQQLGSPCIGILYDPSKSLNPNDFRGVRCLFVDLHLVDGQAGSDDRRHFANIANILENNISEAGGPYVLIVWTEHSQLSTQLGAYLDANMDPKKPHARPLAVLSLDKMKFINVGDGTVPAPDLLRTAVNDALFANAQLAALLSWELEVLSAAADTLSSIVSLVPLDQRTTTAFSQAFDVVLSRLAAEAVGPDNVNIDHRAAITAALAPILADRIMNQNAIGESKAIWTRAITRHADRSIRAASRSEAGSINRMLHVALPGGETIRPTDLGAVVSYPSQDLDFVAFAGRPVDKMVGGEFCIESKDRKRCIPILVRIGAACDFAQSRAGPLTYLLGFEIPEDAQRKTDNLGKPLRPSTAIWESPTLLVGVGEPYRLFVHIRYPVVRLPETCGQWEVRYRLREQLLTTLIVSASNHGSRPGIVALKSGQ
jgi:hypothetical protein